MFSNFLTQYGGVVAHLRLAVLKVVDEDGGEAAHHPDAHVQKEKWYEAQKLSTKRFFFSHIVRLAVQYLLDRIRS